MNSNVSSLHSLETYLNSTRFVDNFFFTEKQKNMLFNPSVLFINEPIAINDILTPSLHRTLEGLRGFLGDTAITFNSLYTEYTKIIAQFSSNYIPYSFPDFINGLSIFELAFRGFNQHLLKISIQMTSEETISVYFHNEAESDSFSIYQAIISKQTSDSPSLMLNNMLFIFYIFSLCGKFSYSKLNQSNYINNLNVYNKFYISHLNYGLLVHLGVMIYCNAISSQVHSTRAENHDTNTMTNLLMTTIHWTKSNLNTNTMKNKRKSKSNAGLIRVDEDNNNQKNNIQGSNKGLMNNIKNAEMEISLILFDSKVIQPLWNDCIKGLICLNSFKWLLYENILNVFDTRINITIINPIEINSTYFGKNFESTFYSKVINILILSIMSSKNIFNKIFKLWPLNKVIIKLELSNQLESINTLFSIYNPLLVKAREIHVKDSTNETESYMSIETLFLEWSILEIILGKMSTIKEDHDSKRFQCSYSFIFNCWKMIISKSSSSKEINLNFNYSYIQEKALFNFFLFNVNLSNFIKNLIKMISLIEVFKGYDTINIRLFQNNFRSKQLEFFLQIIINSIVNHVIERKIDHVININEKNFYYFIPSMQCYINDTNKNNKKHKFNALKQTFNKIISTIKGFKFLSLYLTHLSELFDIIIFSGNPNAFKLVRTYEDRKIFFILTTMDTQTKFWSSSGLISNTMPDDGHISSKKYNMHIYVYLNNEKESYMRTLPLLHSIKIDKLKKCTIEITLICDKLYLESTVLIDQKHKKIVRFLSEDINNMYVISKTAINNVGNEMANSQSNVEYFNYDIYITSENIKLMTYLKYDFVNDIKCKRFLFSFISILSSCIEMILYILKNKDICISKFIFVYKNINDTTYFLYFKGANVFLKKSFDNDNLIRLNVKHAIPLFCLLSKKKTTSYTMSNENFFEVFPRLFLNLHKVNDDKTDNFNDVFFKKIHKNIFYDYYDNFFPIALSYEVFDLFNIFFMRNDYLSISGGDKFAKGYLFSFDEIASDDKSFVPMVIKEVIVLNSNIKILGKEGEATYKFFTFSKLDHLIESLKENIDRNMKDNKKMLCYLNKKITNDDKTNIVSRISKYLFHERIRECYIEQRVIEEKIKKYLKDKVNRENDRVENRITQLTEAAKYENIINKDKNCYLI